MNGFQFASNEDFARFVAATGHRPPPHWIAGKVPAGAETHPVVLVSAEDADAYCGWAGMRLPTDEEAAAMGADRPPFLWEWTSTADRSSRVVRGGAWSNGAWFLRASLHRGVVTSHRLDFVGFRCTRKETP